MNEAIIRFALIEVADLILLTKISEKYKYFFHESMLNF